MRNTEGGKNHNMVQVYSLKAIQGMKNQTMSDLNIKHYVLYRKSFVCVCVFTCARQFVSELLFEGFSLKWQIRGGWSHTFFPHSDPCCFTDHMIQPEVSGLPFSCSVLKPNTFSSCQQGRIEFSSRWVCINKL